MPSKSANSRSKKGLDRPFEPTLYKQAADIAAGYQIILQSEDNEYFGRGLEMPYVMSDGKTPDACVTATRETLTIAVATMLELGEVPPPPASEQKRSEQINIRVTTEEKVAIEVAARGRGFRGVGDFIRSTTLAHLK